VQRYISVILFLLASCSTLHGENDIPLPRIITPTEMFPTPTHTLSLFYINKTKTQLFKNSETGPYIRSEPLIWLPMQNISSFFDDGIPVIKNGFLKYYPLPDNATRLWDYDWKTDTLAYSDVREDITSCSDIVTWNLRIHNYQDNSDYLIMDRVSNAKWSPDVYPGTNEHLLAVEICRRQLIVFPLEKLEEKTIISENADPWFTWSPDSKWISYVTDTNLVIIPSKGGQENIISTNIPWGGSVFDTDIWLKGHNVIILTGNPFQFINLETSESFIPTDLQGNPPEEFRGYKYLWNDKSHTLVSYGEYYSSDRIIFIYILSEDLHTIVDKHMIGTKYRSNSENISEIPVAWWVPGESIITYSKKIWSVMDDNSLIMFFPKI
jgi:hypothetical protein